MSEESAKSGKSVLAQLRHDMRTPINHILGYAELLEEDAADLGNEQLRGDLGRIIQAARNLLRMVNENLTEEYLGIGNGVQAPAPQGGREKEKIEFQPYHTDETMLSAPDEPASVLGRILVVDDNEENREMLARRLERQGHTVTRAENGLAALEQIRSQPFDLVLLDVIMPGLDGLGVLHEMKSDPNLRHIPVIMVSALDELDSVVRCIEYGAEDYLHKPFNPTILRARIDAALEKKAFRDQEQQYLRTIEQTQKRLSEELNEAAHYVRSILPEPQTEPFRIDWSYVPSTELGGDAFGYHWIDDDHFAVYLLDVCGHGVGASLLSVAAINMLRTGALPHADLRDPGQVLAALNEAFPMEKQNNLYFTIWYGVYQKSTRRLRHSSGGHPPAILLTPAENGDFTMTSLRCPGMIVGVMPEAQYRYEECSVPPGSRLFVLCDGTYEIKKTSGEMMEFDEFAEFLRKNGAAEDGLDRLWKWVKSYHGEGPLDDDFSIVRIQF